MKLTELKLRNIRYTDKIKLYADGNGLFLRVSKTKKRWQLSIRKGSKVVHFYGDEYPGMSLKAAREWAEETRELALGSDVQGSSQLSFAHYAGLYRNQQVKNKRSEKTLYKFDVRLEKYLKPIAKDDVRTITPQQMLTIFREIEASNKLEALKQTLGYANNIFLIAKIEGVILSNPCEGLSKILAFGKGKNRAAVTSVSEFAKLLKAIYHENKSQEIIAEALKLSAHLFVRPNELRLARWEEFDLENRIWDIPAERMKMDESLLVPLSTQVVDILLKLKSLSPGPLVFGGSIGKTYSDATLRKALSRMGYYGAHQDLTGVEGVVALHGPHGFRATFRTIADEVFEWSVAILEMQLAHRVRDANGRAYNRTTHLRKRILMMQLWSDFIDCLLEDDEKEIEKFISTHRGSI